MCLEDIRLARKQSTTNLAPGNPLSITIAPNRFRIALTVSTQTAVDGIQVSFTAGAGSYVLCAIQASKLPYTLRLEDFGIVLLEQLSITCLTNTDGIVVIETSLMVD